MCGHGCLETMAGDVIYCGFFADNKPHGQGKLFDSKKTLVYAGAFEHGKPHGEGTWYDAAGLRRGTWAMGSLTTREGVSVSRHASLPLVCKYEGVLFDSVPHGFGTESVADALSVHGFECGAFRVKYEGGFSDGLRHGVGILHRPGAPCFAGVWNKGALKIVLAGVPVAGCGVSMFLEVITLVWSVSRALLTKYVCASSRSFLCFVMLGYVATGIA